MTRIKLASALLAAVCTTLSVASLAETPAAQRPVIAPQVEQHGWAARKKTLELGNGLRVAYVEAGNAAGQPLLLLHGFTDSSRSWSLLVPHLSKYRLLIPDQRGHGASGAPACCYSPAALAEDARLFLDALGIERAGVAGHSLGSIVAMELAAAHPERVSKLALLGSTAMPPVRRGDWLWSNVMGMRFPIDRTSQFMRDWDPANQPTPVDAAFASAAREEIFAIPPHVWRGAIGELAGVPAGRNAAKVTAPVLILSGGKDPLFPAEHHQSLVEAFPGARAQIFAELGHNLQWEQPAAVAVAIDTFLSDPTASELSKLRTLARGAGEQLWPGYGRAAFGFLVLEEDREVLLCRSPMPDGFTADGTDATTGCPRFVRPRQKMPASMLAAMPLFGPPWTIVMGPAPTDTAKLPRWRSTVLHEHVHQWQAELPGYYERVNALGLADGDTSGMWMIQFPFPYAEETVATAHATAARALVAAVEARGTPSFASRLRDYLEARRRFAAAAGARNWRYLEFQFWQEGISRWTEIALMRRSGEPAHAADANRYERQMLDMLRRPDLADQQRVMVYAYGMAEALLLDASAPNWRSRYPEVLALGPLFEATDKERPRAAIG